MTVRYGIKDSHWKKIKLIFASHPEITKSILFGSRAMGTQRDGSDIDVALVGDGELHHILNKIRLQYDDLFLPWKLDLVSYNELNNTNLKRHIDRFGIELK